MTKFYRNIMAPLRPRKYWQYQRKGYAILLLSFVFNVAGAQKSIPALWGTHVQDEARILSQAAVDKLENQLAAFEDSTSNQIAVLTVSSLEGDPLEDYSMRVAEEWKLGQKEKDNGVLFLIVVDEHKMRIEVGYGLEGVLTDAVSSRIIRNEVAPAFRQNQFDEGITKGINSIMLAIKGEYTADDEPGIPELDVKARILVGIFIFVILGIFTALGLFIPGCSGWFLYAFLIPFYAAFPLIVLGTTTGLAILASYVIGFPILKLTLGNTDWGKRVSKKMASANSGRGWSSGSGWSAGSGGGRSSGGFSGGGGSFGGGGASGSW